MNTYIITNGKIVLKDQILLHHILVIEDKKIVDITMDANKYSTFKAIDAKGTYVTPAFVELHIHGCSHYAFDMVDELALLQAVEFLKKRGINTFTPTFICNREAIRQFSNILAGSDILQKSIPGIYIEGPFVNVDKKGGILAHLISKPNIAELKQIITETCGKLKLMTIAPEIPGNKEIFNHLLQNNIIPCFGHSNAKVTDTYTVPDRYINITHLFNAMSGISHKTSGLAMLPFMDDSPFFELNSDGVHVNDEAVVMCYKYLNHNKLILISDAVISAGLKPGEYETYGRAIVSGDRGVRYKENDILMGSNLLINDILKRFLKLTGAPLHEGMRFASYNPCHLLGISDKKGSIELGKEADLLLLDEDYNVVMNLG